ncbi:glycosyltransferase family 2 protein [Flavobacterium algicola]|uniref:glycosyltransferase family 2 protein n=1 Tax=Flavobacterium algicola TaxID=556529 RepID=UPI001EFCC575|nr:glycosyltransferase family 2 protein [Flavobacterium algicola]MCG9793903.1 glycosyltransferase [Flavobacterium algicola]
MRISVIIPAYNVERFIEKAITSATQHSEVYEVIVVDDGSTDDTCSIIEKLQKTNAKIKLFYHEGNLNKGRSATRNKAIREATGNFISFLDADDYYLENRFINDSKVFKNNAGCEGVYNAVGFQFYRQASEQEKKNPMLNTINRVVPPHELFEAVVSSKYGYLHLNGLTVKKEVFDTVGYFNENLKVAEDSDFIYKLALKHSICTGIIDAPLAMRGIHDINIFDQVEIYKIYNIKMYESVIKWSCENKIALSKIDRTLHFLWLFKFKEGNSLFTDSWYWIKFCLTTPRILFSPLWLKYFPVVRKRQLLFPFIYNIKKR